MVKKRCIFFDRDGIVNVSPGPGYVERVEDFHLIPAFFDALRVASERGYVAVIVTNQRGVGRGLMTQETLDQIHAKLYDQLRKEGLAVLDLQYCTANDNSDPRRKPNPGMLLDAARQHDLDLAASWMVGDNESDVTAGHRAGCRAILVAPPEKAPSAAEVQVANMTELAAYFRRHL